MLGEPFDLMPGRLPAQHTRLRHGQDVGVVLGLLGFGRLVVRGLTGGRGRGGGVQLGASALKEVRVPLPHLAAWVPPRLPAPDRRRAHAQGLRKLCAREVQIFTQGASFSCGGQRCLLPDGGKEGVDRVEVRHQAPPSTTAERTPPTGRPDMRRRSAGRASTARVGPARRSYAVMP